MFRLQPLGIQTLGIQKLRIQTLVALIAISTAAGSCLAVETLRQAEKLEAQLKRVAPPRLAQIARQRGDARRGALIFYTSSAACANCHLQRQGESPLGPDLANLGDVTDVHVIESLLEPSKSIRSQLRRDQCL